MARRGILGLFRDVGAAVNAADGLKAGGIAEFQVLSDAPYPEGAFGEPPSHHRLFVFPLVGASLGLSLGLLLTAGTQLAYPLVTGGKPILSIPPMFIISYEATMLGAILFTILGVIFESRLPRMGMGLYDPRITEGYIGIEVSVPEEQVAQVQQVFQRAQAVDIKVEGQAAARR
jgi:hypothetical protein